MSITPSPVDDRTFNPWPGRALRLLVLIAIIATFLLTWRFMTYHVAGSSEFGDTNHDRCQSVQIFPTKEAAFDARSELRYYDDSPWFYEHDGSYVTNDEDGKFALFINDNTSCSWTDNFHATWFEYLMGAVAAVFAIMVTIILATMLALAVRWISLMLWYGKIPGDKMFIPEPCRDPACSCRAHGPQYFDNEDQEWYETECNDDNCECKDH